MFFLFVCSFFVEAESSNSSPVSVRNVLDQRRWSGDHAVEPVLQVLLRHLLPDRSRLGRRNLFVCHLLRLLLYHLLHVLTRWGLKEHTVTLTILIIFHSHALKSGWLLFVSDTTHSLKVPYYAKLTLPMWVTQWCRG